MPQEPYDLSDPELPFWLALNRVHGIGPARFQTLLQSFGTAENVWRADLETLLAAGVDARTVASLTEQRRRIVPEAEVDRLLQLGVGVLRLIDSTYPPLLAEINLPPPVLYVRGRLLPDDAVAIAIVGTRKATSYGRQVTQQLAAGLAERRVTVVSGLARGVDACAHAAALAAGGRTVAVLGCGPDLIYPPEHARLSERLIENGAIITSFPPGTPPEAGNFPARNRLISGLSLGVVVTEAPRQSGALITAGFAGEQGRDVFAVPGSIFSKTSVGAHQLIQDGAKLVMSVEDILSELNLTNISMLSPAGPNPEPESGTEARLLELLGGVGEALHVDELSYRLGLPVATISATLAILELRGMVIVSGPMTYALAREP